MSPLRRLQSVSTSCNVTGTCNVNSTEEVWSTLMAVYLGTILMLSVVFNGTICLVFYKKPHLLSISNCFVLNLTCCQLGKIYVFVYLFIHSFVYLIFNQLINLFIYLDCFGSVLHAPLSIFFCTSKRK